MGAAPEGPVGAAPEGPVGAAPEGPVGAASEGPVGSWGPRLGRRRLLGLGGAAAATALALGACGRDRAAPPAVTTPVGPPSRDVDDLRLASSLEHLAVDLYRRLAAPDPDLALLAGAMTLFGAHHRDHAALFERATSQRGGQPYANPNPVVAREVRDQLAAAGDEASRAAVAYDLEARLAATYLAGVGRFEDAGLNQVVMGVAGVAARHVTVLGQALAELGRGEDRPALPGEGFATSLGAVAPGTGI